jgi:hypothetical protein
MIESKRCWRMKDKRWSKKSLNKNNGMKETENSIYNCMAKMMTTSGFMEIPSTLY